ncbi:MAG: collagenase-like protease [Bacteroidia bacterium]|nr:MAG: collagenase-like protease [Bacteroidia bacterium]
MRVELLAPAPTADIGRLAIDAGADAVYIGPPRFGARQKAGNPIADIERLAAHAHTFGARVYATLNTLLLDGEIAEAQRCAWDLYHAGVDALIVQDMAWAGMDLPPLPLHASTQMDNRTLGKLQFLEAVGFTRAILARELSLAEIGHLARGTNLQLEAFVHGALCVCYSGQCYLSEVLGGRSANRGACAQPCRLPYTLRDAEGRVMARDGHLLSLKDLNQTRNLEALIEAGVGSLKIEGRLKDAAYVQNITAHYRQQLDALMARHADWERASDGAVEHGFTPHPQLTFARQQDGYFAHGRAPRMASTITPKAVGEALATVRSVEGLCIGLELRDGAVPLANGDGLCAVTPGGLVGFRANRVEQDRVYTLRPVHGIAPGDTLYRNSSTEFNRQLEACPPRRYYPLRMRLLRADDGGWVLKVDDGIGEPIVQPLDAEVEQARDENRARQTWERQLARSSDPRVRVVSVSVEGGGVPFLPISAMNTLRRKAVDAWLSSRQARATRGLAKALRPVPLSDYMPTATPPDYRLNVTNELAARFYAACGLDLARLPLRTHDMRHGELMRTRYCLRHEMDLCPRRGDATAASPLFLHHDGGVLRLTFDCRACEMVVTLAD